MIPVHRPKLPSCDLILPYLNEIDESRWYSNFGPLLTRFENRLSEHFDVAPAMLTTAANGTLMLVSILKSMNIPENSFCIIPSWTFIATPSAACYAGLIPYFVDVDRETQTLNPAILKLQIARIKQPIGAVIVVAPFGAPIDTKSWDEFTDQTGIPVIIDAAAAFDAVKECSEMRLGHSPAMISLHATKVFGVGEGGLVISSNTDLVKKIKLNTSFGFNGNREAITLGYNAKLSEYTAAVGLAALDIWRDTRSAWERVRNDYMNNLDTRKISHGLSAEWVSSTYNVIVPEKADRIAALLAQTGIDTRKWWGNGCHQHPAYRHFPKMENLENTDWLNQSILGLPCAPDLETSQINHICEVLDSVLHHVEILAQSNYHLPTGTANSTVSQT